MNESLDPKRVVRELRELQALTGDNLGAQRVAWTPTWDKARAWFREKLRSLPVEVSIDEAGNLWTLLRGQSESSLIIGGHLDSVPNGGWLDGSLNTLAGLEVLRRIAADGTPPVSVALVDWADEEGARFGRSLFGSSSVSNTIDVEALKTLRDKDGVSLESAISNYDLSFDTLKNSRARLENAKAYVELHIEQGPVLESSNQALAAVLGTVGIRRHRITFTGQSAHAGTTPMSHRRDALAAAARLTLEIRDIANRHSGVCTVGRVNCSPGISSAVVGTCEILLEQRHLNAKNLDAMVQEAKQASVRFAKEEQVDQDWQLIWEIPPVPFHPELIALADNAVVSVCGQSLKLPSGALHDASEVARAGVPTAMLFVQSLRGLSHTKEENTHDEHLELSVRALDALVSDALNWIAR